MGTSRHGAPFAREWAAARRVADGLRALGDPRAGVVASGAYDAAFGVASPESVERLRLSQRPSSGPLDLFMAPVTWLGSDVWLFDDDGYGGVLGPSDPGIARLARELRGRPHARIHAQLFHRGDQLADALSSQRAWPRLAHVISASPPPGLLDRATELTGLTGPWEGLAPHLDGPPTSLRALTLTSHPARRAARVLDAVSRRCPALHHLGLWHGTALDWLAHPVVEGLQSLDLYTVNQAQEFVFAALLAQRARLSHLRRILVPGHLVSERARADFSDWPEVVFVSYDRVEVVALDVATMGFPRGHR